MTTFAAFALGSLLTFAPLPPPRDVDPTTLPIALTHYDPALGGINCSADCSTFGSGLKIQPHHYNTSAACITAWRGKMVVVKGAGSWWCRDSGGAIGVHYRPEWGLFVYVDVLSKTPVHPGPYPNWWLEAER